jgi:hypothetical protein
VEYKPGKLNTMADALSVRKSVSIPFPHLLFNSDQIRETISACASLSALRNNIIAGLKEPEWSVRDDLILKKGKIYIPSDSI